MSKPTTNISALATLFNYRKFPCVLPEERESKTAYCLFSQHMQSTANPILESGPQVRFGTLTKN